MLRRKEHKEQLAQFQFMSNFILNTTCITPSGTSGTSVRLCSAIVSTIRIPELQQMIKRATRQCQGLGHKLATFETFAQTKLIQISTLAGDSILIRLAKWVAWHSLFSTVRQPFYSTSYPLLSRLCTMQCLSLRNVCAFYIFIPLLIYVLLFEVYSGSD
jgi:hypothetical protein